MLLLLPAPRNDAKKKRGGVTLAPFCRAAGRCRSSAMVGAPVLWGGRVEVMREGGLDRFDRPKRMPRCVGPAIMRRTTPPPRRAHVDEADVGCAKDGVPNNPSNQVYPNHGANHPGP